jgi:tRNA dimethylallyltransferase
MKLAVDFGAEIISVDSMQAYRGMDIGTAKPSAAVRRRVRHHLIDIADPETDLTVSAFQRLGRVVIDAPDRPPILIVGGSGLHFRALVDPLEFPPHDAGLRAEVDRLSHEAARVELLEADPGAGDVLDIDNPRRVQRALEIHRLTGQTPTERASTAAAGAVRRYEPRTPFVAVGVDPGDALEGRIRRRLTQMVEAGLIEEVARVGPNLGRNAAQAVGYKQLLPVVAGSCSLADGVESAVAASLALAKRQRTFFRRDPRIHWLEWVADPAELAALARRRIEEHAPWTS